MEVSQSQKSLYHRCGNGYRVIKANPNKKRGLYASVFVLNYKQQNWTMFATLSYRYLLFLPLPSVRFEYFLNSQAIPSQFSADK